MNYLTASNWSRWEFIEGHPDFHVYSFEKIDYNYWMDFADSYANTMLFTGLTFYLLGIWVLVKWMEDRAPFDLRRLLIAWNVLVALFSTWLCVRLWPELSRVLRTHGFYKGVCHRVEGHVPTPFYGLVGSLFKIALCFDTTLLVLRKKRVDTAHVVHHVAAAIFVAKITPYVEPAFRWMGFANYLTLAIDYTLLALMTMGKPLPNSRLIMVALEVVQMLWIIFVSLYTLVLRALDIDCMRHPNSIAIANGIATAVLVFVLANVASPEYWKRDEKRRESRGTSTAPSLKKRE